ncbi:MAG: flavin-containing monooxygenase [Dermatophilaceae bacterium]
MDEVVVVGAGPAGLAAGASLIARGVRVVVLEQAARVGEPWRGRYDRLHLHTVRWLSGLPGYRIPREFGRWVARDQFVEYLERYAVRQGIEPCLGVQATSIERAGRAWRVNTTRQAFDAQAVVVATGYSRVPYLPPWASGFAGPLRHASTYRNPEPYRGRDVLVVGAGNSGTEIAVDLAAGGAARVRLAVRASPVIVRRDTLGIPTQLVGIATRGWPPSVMDPLSRAVQRATVPDLTAYGIGRPARPYTRFLRTATAPIVDVGFVDAVRSGAVEVVGGVVATDGPDVVLADGGRLRPEAIIAATGYRPGLEPLVGHLGILGEQGIPSSTLPGLHFAAISVPLSGLLREAALDGRRIARAIAGQRAVSA